MEKILVLGNERTKEWSKNVPGSVFVSMPIFSLGEDGETKLSEFVSNNIVTEVSAIVFDVDNIQNNAICLSMAICIRLSVLELKKTALVPIMFMTGLGFEQFLGTPYAAILFTKGIYVDNPENVMMVIGSLSALPCEEYKSGFVNLIKVNPNAAEGRHSIANQWGADVLNRVLTGGITTNISIQKARTSLYFKYVLLQTLNAGDLEDYILGKNARLLVTKKSRIPIDGKKILLLDDEADKGWGDILQSLFRGGTVNIICERVKDYESLSDTAKKAIEQGDYDLILLDLRLNGLEEENVYNPADFSGMKILRRIKQLNRGTQVIVFTASNKAWNLKALIEEGADGYYIKESPEYHLPIKYSEHNVDAFREEISRCLKRSYLKDVYKSIQVYKNCFSHKGIESAFTNAILNHLGIAFNMLEKANDKQQHTYAYAYVCLEQILEIVSEEFTSKKDGYFLIIETGERCKNYVLCGNVCKEEEEYVTDVDFPQWKRISSVYYQLWKGSDNTFGADMQRLISKRNAFIHNDKRLLEKSNVCGGRKARVLTDIFNATTFLELYKRIEEILTNIKDHLGSTQN